MKRLISLPHSHSDLYEWLRKSFLLLKVLMDKFNATHLTFGTGKMKSLLRLLCFSFFSPSPLSGGLLLFVIWRQKGTRENTVISFPPPRRHSCSVSTKQDVYLETPPKSCHPAQRGISYLFMYSLRAQRKK